MESKALVILVVFILAAIALYILCRCFGDKYPNCYRKKQKTWNNDD